MSKKILAAFFVILIIAGGFCFYLVNPFDPQYKSFYSEMQAYQAYQKGDIDTFIKYMSTPVTLKYHAPVVLYLTLANKGRYDEAIAAINAFQRYRDYSVCAQYKPAMRVFCRLSDIFFPVQPPKFDKNYWLSKIYFDKGDYKTAVDYLDKSTMRPPCYSAKLYAAAENFELADKEIKLCEAQYAPKKYKYALYSTKGYYYLRQKKYDVALDYLTKAVIKVAPKYKNYRGNNTTYLLLAQLYKEQNKLDKARYYYELVIKTDPDNYRAQKGLGLILHK